MIMLFYQLAATRYNSSSRLLIAIIAMSLCVVLLVLSVNFMTFDFTKITFLH